MIFSSLNQLSLPNLIALKIANFVIDVLIAPKLETSISVGAAVKPSMAYQSKYFSPLRLELQVRGNLICSL